MKKELGEVILDYSTKSKEIYLENIAKQMKENLAIILTDLIELTINDKNSSLLREEITALVADYIPLEEKIGYDAYKIDANGNRQFVEIKPKNIFLKSNGQFNTKLDGAGNFTDFSFAKLDRDKKDNIIMLVSGFISGELIYILKFDFNEPDFIKRMEKNLFGKYKDGKDVVGDWLRSSSFSFNDYKNAQSLSKVYVITNLTDYKNQITRNLYNYLMIKES